MKKLNILAILYICLTMEKIGKWLFHQIRARNWWYFLIKEYGYKSQSQLCSSLFFLRETFYTCKVDEVGFLDDICISLVPLSRHLFAFTLLLFKLQRTFLVTFPSYTNKRNECFLSAVCISSDNKERSFVN